MPEENYSPSLKLAIEKLEDFKLENHRTRSQCYQVVQDYVENLASVNMVLVERVLKVCVHDLKEDMKHTAIILNIISAILKKLKEGQYGRVPDLIPSALSIINVFIVMASLNNSGALRIMCVNTFMLYPDETLVTIATAHYDDLMGLLNLPGQARIQVELRVLTYDIFHKIIIVLPPENKLAFVRNGISMWFLKLIPTILTYVACGLPENSKPIDLLEVLTDELLKLNYTDSPQWSAILECICNSNKYPQIMKNLLEKGSPLWHRLWIVFIRLLNNQITRNTNSVGTPINSMLPVVETAFKMDATNRCKAFHCWSVLINIFSKETNENCIAKRLKLLIIPLKLNNAKTEETATAKFDAWWLLITKFQTKLDKFVDSILIAFLHFCFGKHNSSGKSTFIPGILSNNLKKRGLEAFVEIIGHQNCDRCNDIAIPRLEDRLLTTKYLVDYWNDWAHSLKSAMKLSLDVNNKQYFLCLWKSFLFVIGNLPDSNVKKGVFNELLTILATSFQDCGSENISEDIIFKALIPSLFEDELKYLLKGDADAGTLKKLVSIILDPSMKSVYQSHPMQETVAKLKPLTDLILDESSKCTSKNNVEQILHDLPSNDTTLMLWTALAESVCNSEHEILCLKSLHYLLQWPLKSTNMFTDVYYAAKTWYKMYDLNFLKLSNTSIDKDISKMLLSCNIVMHSSIYFTLCATIAILKNGLAKFNSTEYEKEAELLRTLLNRIDNYESIQEVFQMLLETVVVMVNTVKNAINENFAEITLMSVKIILKLIVPVLKQDSDISKNVTLLRMLLESIESLFQVESYSNLCSIVVDNLKQDCVHFEDQLLLKDVVQSILKKSSMNEKENNKTICDSIDLTLDNVVDNDTDLGKAMFTTPNIKEVPKKSKKKEASIVNTVENGEEFLVVKSNWKFNPRKLTENQKEKFQKNKEQVWYIPALYQDLSQSQDEFKMAMWKTDSQDNSTSSKSSSKSANAVVDATNILKNLPSTDVVPKIMENILSDTGKKEIDKPSDELNNIITKESPKELQSLTPKHKKTPRMALKDRVFRNVRNLIEKSTTSTISKDTNDSCNQVDILKTPPSKPKDTGHVVNSAPSLLLCDRPTRVKRIPKKFDDTEIFAIKKRRHSQSESVLNSEELEHFSAKPDVEEVIERIEDKENTSKSTKNDVEILDDTKEIENVNAVEEPNFSDTEKAVIVEIDVCKENISTEDNITTKSSECPSTDMDQNDIGDANKEKLEPEKESATTNNINGTQKISTPTHTKIKENKQHTPSVKKSGAKKSRIEKELAIDMVEGHPFLNTPTTSVKRKTRKNVASPVNCLRRKNLVDKFDKLKSDSKTPLVGTKKDKSAIKKNDLDEMKRTDERSVSSPEGVNISEESCSEDIIESSQDSTLTTITVIKKTPKRLPVVTIEKMQMNPTVEEINDATQNLLDDNLIDEFSDPKKENISKYSNQNKTTTIIDNIKENNGAIEQEINEQVFSLNNENEIQETCDVVCSENLQSTENIDCSVVVSDCSLLHQDSKDDTELPRNKTAVEDKNQSELTENMDTAPLDQDISDDVIVIDDEEQPVISVSSDENVVGPQTQEIAEADTQPNEITEVDIKTDTNNSCLTEESAIQIQDSNNCAVTDSNPKENVATSVLISSTSLINVEKASDVSSPFKDDIQRKQDFLNNTIEISPIKTMSPDREKKSPSPDTSGDYVVIKLSSPVHSNGEPFEKSSPEFFTEDKTSPDNREQSPPRSEMTVINTSPSSSLSLKKNRPQVRSGGRAAQMLGLCVPDKLNPLMNSDRLEIDEVWKSSPSNTPARRNLRILYNSVGDTSDNIVDNEEHENVLKLKRSLPAVSSSPSGPILKRKHVEITDDTTVSPANKRKRVSFHDPPVSTTITVQKYIEPCGVRSPQNSAHKRQERQARMLTNLKSPKRLDSLFTLDSVLTKAVESFTDVDLSLTNAEDTQITSLDQTPAVEIVKTSELNDTDPICPQLLDCKDSIDNIATELSSPAMKALLIKELEGKVETISDLAKMTELEVNRLCIKAPKVKVAKKVLTEYTAKTENNKMPEQIEEAIVDVDMVLSAEILKSADIAIQTNELVSSNVEMQTCDISVSLVSTQTDIVSTSCISVQTDESGSKTTAEIVQTCLLEKPDFVAQLSEQLNDSSIQQIINKLTFGAATDMLMTKIDPTNSKIVLDRLLDNQCPQESSEQNSMKQLMFLRNYLYHKFGSKDLILFCSELLKDMYDKPT